MALNQELINIKETIIQDKILIANAINEKNDSVNLDSSNTFVEYADAIGDISGGGGSVTEKYPFPNGAKFYSSKVSDIDLSKYEFSGVTDMSYMFYNCSNLTSLNLSDMNTSKVTDMSSMFTSCKKLTLLDLSNLNINNVTNMNTMFNACSSLIEVDLSNLNTSNVTNINMMFGSCTKLTTVDLSNFNATNITSSSYNPFSNCNSLINLKFNDLGHNEEWYNTSLIWSDELTRESCLFLFNHAYDRATAEYSKAFTISLHADTKALLSEEDLAIATMKGFTIA